MSGRVDILEKIRALRNLEQSSNLNEAQAAARAAARLIEQHRIEEVELELAGEEPAEAVEIDPNRLFPCSRRQPWQGRLVQVLAKHHGCECWIESKWQDGQRQTCMRLVGRPSDTAIVRHLAAWLATELSRLCEREAKGQGRAFRNSWLHGAVTGIRVQLDELRREAPQTTAAMVLYDRGKEAEAMLAAMRPRAGRKSRFSDRGAFLVGMAAGKSVRLGGADLPSASRPSLPRAS